MNLLKKILKSILEYFAKPPTDHFTGHEEDKKRREQNLRELSRQMLPIRDVSDRSQELKDIEQKISSSLIKSRK